MDEHAQPDVSDLSTDSAGSMSHRLHEFYHPFNNMGLGGMGGRGERGPKTFGIVGELFVVGGRGGGLGVESDVDGGEAF